MTHDGIDFAFLATTKCVYFQQESANCGDRGLPLAEMLVYH